MQNISTQPLQTLPAKTPSQVGLIGMVIYLNHTNAWPKITSRWFVLHRALRYQFRLISIPIQGAINK